MSTIQTTNSNQSDFIQVRLDPKTKKAATNILNKLGLSPSQAIKLFLSKVILTRSIPFSVELPSDYVEELSDEQSAEVALALNQIKNGQYTEVDMGNQKQVNDFFGI